MAQYIRSLSQICPVSEYGGKAYHLSRLKHWGFSVPEGFCLPARLLRQFLLRNDHEQIFLSIQEAISQGEFPETHINAIRDTLRVGRFPDRFLKQLEGVLGKGFADNHVAVRSSALSEDGDKYSFAGMLESVLSVPPQVESVLAAIRQVWASLFGDRVIGYAIENRLSAASLDMGVIIQKMVPAEKGGVAFSLNPVNGDPEVVYVEEASAGADQVVGGSIRPEIHTVNKRMPPNLNSHMEWLMLLSRMVMKIESRFNRPVDVEWAWANDQLHILQARPITAIDPDKTTIWTDENVGEVLPEVVTPLTWSILGPMTNASFRWTLNQLGLHPPRKEKLFRLIHGKAYFNHSLFNRTLEKVFGGGFAPKGFLKRSHDLLVRRAFILLCFAWMCVWLPFRSKIALRKNRHLPDIEAVKDIDAEIHRIVQLESELMRLHVANTFLGEIIYQILVGMVQRLKSPEAASTVAEWISGVGETGSTRSGAALQRVARNISRRVHNGAIDLHSPRELASLLESDPSLRRVLDEFIARHGHNSDQEFELRHPRWGEQPESLYPLLFKIIPEFDDGASHLEAKPASAAPEKDFGILALLAGFSKVLNRNRENLKQAFIKGHYRLKQILLTKARLLVDRELLASEDSIYFLTRSEIEQTKVLNSQTDAVHYRTMTERRQDEYHRQQNLKHPGRWLEKEGQFIAADPSEVRRAGGDEELRGIPCSSGCAEGSARVLNSFREGRELRPGEILIVHSANPGWTPLFLLAKGIVCEIGGALSHSAIIAREYGIPMVAAVKNITSRVKTGDRIRIDGAAGFVEILNSNAETVSTEKAPAPQINDE